MPYLQRIYLLTISLISLSLFFEQKALALPSESLFCERAIEGLRWHKAHSFCHHLTEEKLRQIQPIIRSVLQKEKDLHRDYYQVITGQDSSFLAYQIILKELYRLKYNKTFKDYEFFRPYKSPKLKRNVRQFLLEHPDLTSLDRVIQNSLGLTGKRSEEYWCNIDSDTKPEIRKQLISASLTLETMSSEDSALYVFACKRGVCQPGDKAALLYFLKEAFALEGYQSKQIESLLSRLLQMAPTSSEGMLMQIFVPKTCVSKVLYVANTGGFVKQNETKDIHGYFKNYEALRDSRQFDKTKANQVRILAGALDPEEVKIFRHTTIDKNAIKNYEQWVKEELSIALHSGQLSAHRNHTNFTP